MSDQLTDLLLALAGAPALPGARCRGKAHLFDEAAHGEAAETVEQRHAQALALCRSCTALASCSSWFESLPRTKQPTGVIAGKLHRADTGTGLKRSAT